MFHILIVFILGMYAYLAMKNEGNIQAVTFTICVGSLVLSFLSAFFIKVENSFRKNLFITLPIAIICFLAFPVYAFSDLVLDSIYMYFLFQLPYSLLPFVDGFDAITVLLFTLLFFVTTTLGVQFKYLFLKNRMGKERS